jgi:hypothetical protein
MTSFSFASLSMISAALPTICGAHPLGAPRLSTGSAAAAHTQTFPLSFGEGETPATMARGRLEGVANWFPSPSGRGWPQAG